MRSSVLAALAVVPLVAGCATAVVPAAEMAGSVWRGGLQEVVLEGEDPIRGFTRAALEAGCALGEVRAYAAEAECADVGVRVEAQALDGRTLRLRGAALGGVARARTFSLADEAGARTMEIADRMAAAGFVLLGAERRRL